VLITGLVSDLTRSQSDILAENALLRQQVIALECQVKRPRKPKVAPETIQLIKQMAKENQPWGAERIQGELLKVGIRISKRTVQKYMAKVKKSASTGQNWSTLIKGHARDIWVCDFTTAYDWLFRQFYIFVIIELNTRRIIHCAVTASPTDEWTA